MTLLGHRDRTDPRKTQGARVESAEVDWVYAVLLAGAVAVLVAAEWPRLTVRLGMSDRVEGARRRSRRKRHLRLVETDSDDDFAASVQRDLERLPTIDERDR